MSHVTPPPPLARVRTSRRYATHAPPRPAWPVSRRSVLLHALAHLPALAARPAPPGGAARHTAPQEARSRSHRSHRSRQAAGHARTRTATHNGHGAHPGRENVILSRAAARQGDILHHGNAGGAGMCDPRRAVPPALPAEKPRVGTASAALPRDRREPRRRETGDHPPGRRCPCDCACVAMVKVPSVAARAVPPIRVRVMGTG